MKDLKSYVLIILIFLLFSSCPLNRDLNSSNEFIEIPLLDTPDQIIDFVETYDEPLNDYFYEYALRYNRVNTLVNSVLFIDHNKTDRQSLISLSDAALKEVEDFISFCKEMEIWSESVFEPAIENEKQNISKDIFLKSKVGGMSDIAYARRLVEMYLDVNYGTTFSPSDISRKTGIEMSKIRFLMNQVSREYLTQVDIVNEEVIAKEVEFCETVRDTAGAVNSTLALATPLGAFTSATASVTTTAAAATGWIQKAKYATTVLENASAAITFTNNVVNIAVEEDNIPTAVKTVNKYNSYISLVFGGASGFSSSTRGEKALAIIGTATDGVTNYINIDDEGIKLSQKPQLSTTINNIDVENYNGALAKGNYKIPDQENIDDWTFADFDWNLKGDSYWQNIYDKIEDVSSDTYKEFEDLYMQFVEDWRVNNGDNLTTSETIEKDNILPEFFEDGGDEDFNDYQDIAIIPNQDEFEVSIVLSGANGLVPYNAKFRAKLNNRFLLDNLKLYWDFGDGTSLIQAIDEDGFNPEINHLYSSEGIYSISLRAVDNRGFSAEADVNVSVGNNLQDVIDGYEGSQAIIYVPPGTYTGGYISNRVLRLYSGITLWGNKDSTFIDASVEMYPNTRLEGFTFVGTNRWGEGIIFEAQDDDVKQDLETYDIEIINNVFNSPEHSNAIYLRPIVINDVETLYSGEIKNNVFNNLSNFLICGSFKGEISYNKIYGSNSNPSLVLRGLVDSNINNNLFENSGGIRIINDVENSNILENTFINTRNSGSIKIVGDLFSNSRISKNNISYCEYNKGGISINIVDQSSKVSENTITKSNGRGIYISTLDGEISENEISENTSRINMSVNNLNSTGIIKDNIIIDNKKVYDNISPHAYPAMKIGSFEGSITNNIISNNSCAGLNIYDFKGGQLFGNTIFNNQNCGVYIGPIQAEQPSYIIKDSNNIYNNSVYDDSYYYVDLSTPWEDDTIPDKPAQ